MLLDSHLEFCYELLRRMDVVWSFMLMLTRFSAMMVLIPGIGMGPAGITIRLPGIVVMSFVSLLRGPYAPLPSDWAMMCANLFSEILFGMLLGVIPAMIISGAQVAAQLSTGAMGLSASQLIDPTSGISLPSIGRLFGDLLICLFLLIDGHHTVLYAVSGLGGTIVPGTFLVNEATVSMVIDRMSQVFVAGVMISAPVVVALLLTQFVMGLISRAVPQVNIFIVSFPLTIGIGLMLTMLSLPEVVHYIERDFQRMDREIVVATEAARQVEAAPK